MLAAVFILIASTPSALLEKNISFNIMGGEPTEIDEFPHAVALFIETDDDPNVGRGCGASVLNQIILLTAASCVKTTRDKVEAYTGNKYMWDGMVSMVRRIRRHPKFNEESFSCDIALMRLTKALVLGPTIGRVVLMRIRRKWSEEIAGFGASEGGKRSYLKFVQQKIMNRRACLKHLAHVPRGTFCARHPYGYPAYDDAGSALVQRRYIQTGILSFENVPDSTFAIYTNVSFYYNWVTTNAKQLICPGRDHKERSDQDNTPSYEQSDDASEHKDTNPEDSRQDSSYDEGNSNQYSHSEYTVEETDHGWKDYDNLNQTS